MSVDVVMFCNATGVPGPRIFWYKDGSQSLLGTGGKLHLSKVQAKDKGRYECRASNSVGNSSRFAELKVYRK